MNKKTFVIIGILMCLLFTIPMVSAADANADSDLIDNSVIGSHINSQAITTSDANSLDTNSIDNVLSNANINAKGINSNNNANGIINQNLTKDPEIGIDDSLINNSEKITDINSGNNKNSKYKNNLRANALGEGEGTFAQLYDLINQAAAGSTITLSNNYKFVAGDDAYKSGIIIDKELTINGDGHTIDGSNLARIFYTQGEVVITLNNLVLINGNAGDGDGGAIIWDSHSGHINNVNISNCVAQNGGAIFIGHVGHDEPCFIENITIKYSNATNGGGIYLLTPTAMHNITCINCTASQDGGAIYAYSDGQGRGTDIFTFYNNTAKNGGAAYIRGNNLTITDVDAQNNTATEYGGAIYADGNHLVLDGIKFINNNATRRGGAIFIYGDNNTVENSNFYNHLAHEEGGAIYVDGKNTTIGNSTFTNNTSWDDGGAITWEGDLGRIYNITCLNNSGIGNTHTSSGGTISIYGSNLTMDTINITHGYVTETDRSRSAKGGGIFLTGNNVNITNVAFEDCFTNSTGDDSSGGALYIIGNNTHVVNATFSNNSASENGGAVCVVGENCTLNNSMFANNTAHDDGGAVQWNGNNGRIYNVTANNNYADSARGSSKGGTFTIEGNNTTILKVNISNSYVDSDHNLDPGKTTQGGGIFLTGNNCNITDAVFENCSVKYAADESSGGAIYIIGHNATVVNATFKNNTAYEDGGAIYIEGNNCVLNNTVFINNTAHNDGGAIDWKGSYGSVYNLTAIDNHADSGHGSSKGGTLLLEGGHSTFDVMNITNSYVSGETYTGTKPVQGGGIAISGNDCNISNSVFDNCSVNYVGTNSSGGAIYIWGNDTNIVNCNFTNNSVPSDGGAIYVGGSDVTVVDSNFIDNNASTSGGAIFLTDNKNSQINGSTFKNNSAKVNGGAIDFYAGAEDGLVSSCEFIDNIASGAGGSIYWEGTRGIVEYSNFTGSRATGAASTPNSGRGGSIIWLGDRGIIRECVFNDSQSTKEGSALYILGENDNVYYSNFTNCYSKTNGTVYIHGGYATIGTCYMNNNTVNGSGGGIYVLGNFINLYDTSINNTKANMNGSGLYILGNRTQISNTNLTNSVAADYGGFYIAGYRTFIDGAHLENNTANYGAGIYVSGDQTEIKRVIFSNNTAIQSGGGLYYEGRGITLSDSIFDKNTAKKLKGGSIYFSGKQGDSILRCNFTNGWANTNAGGIAWTANGNGGLIKDCYFENMSSGQHGACIHWEKNNNGTIDNCTFVNSIARTTKNGGAVYMGTNPRANFAVNPVISNCLVINCTQGNRGAINLLGINLTVVNNTFINITGTGGDTDGFRALEIENGLGALILNNTFINCSGNGNGGGARVLAGENITVANNTFIDCHNTRSGGGFYSGAKGFQIFENNTFINNSGQKDGGAAAFTNLVTSFKNNTFINNSVVVQNSPGGAVAVVANTFIDNSTFINNSATLNNGGAVYASGTLTVNNSYFENNHANNTGGAIRVYNGNLKVSNSTFINNTAKQGGAISPSSNVYVNESSVFMYNKAETGSAISANNVYINDTVLLQNQALFNKWSNQRESRVGNHASINATFVGNDNLLNAINANSGTFRNVTYCGVDGGGLYEETTTNTNSVTSAKSTNEVHQLIILEIYDIENNLVDTLTTFTDANGKFNFEVDLANAADLYSYKIIHPEDNYYTGAEYTIGKALSNLTISSQNITHPEDENITFTVTGAGATPTGNITVFINDTNGTVIYNDTILLNGSAQASLSLPRLNATEYYISAKYNGDDTYLPDNETDVFHVNMGESFIIIGIENYTYNETRNISITIPYIEEGKISVIVSNDEYTQLYTVYVSEGTEQLEIELPVLDAGEYNIQAIFHGNNNYYPSENTTNFTVFKAASIINVTVENVTGGEKAIANIHIDPEVSTQTVNITVRNENGDIVDEYEGIGLTNSIVSQTLKLLPKGKYNVTVVYEGDKNHNGSENSTIFYVTKDLFPIEIEAINMTYGDDQIINITVPISPNLPDPDKLYLKLNWTENGTVTTLGYTIDENGIIHIDTADLTERLNVGNYTIDVYYEGDDNYLSNSSSFIFEVVKADVDMTVIPQNITYGAIENITIDIPKLNEIGQNDALTLYVNSTTDESIRFIIENYDIGSDGKAIWNVSTIDGQAIVDHILPAGEYIFEAVYAGSSNYNPANRTERFTVSKAIPHIDIQVENIFVDDNEYINVTVSGPQGALTPTGNITIIVRTYEKELILNSTGQANFTLLKEIEGTGVSVTVIYNGDNNYNMTVANTHYNVTKRNSSVEVVDIPSINYGSLENVNITVNYTDATGEVTVEITSEDAIGFETITKVFELTVDSEGKIRDWTIDDKILPVGNYSINVTYLGNYKYNGNSTIVKFVVEKNSECTVEVEANETAYLNDEIIKVTVTGIQGGAIPTGNVTIVLKDSTGAIVSIPEALATQSLVGGVASFSIPDLQVDEYTIEATYNGDSNYGVKANGTEKFNITKIDSHIAVSGENIYYGQIENITVSLPDTNASGKLIIRIINKTSGEEIKNQSVDEFITTDGVIYPFADLKRGNYTVKVEYYGDHNYNNSTAEYDFEVYSADPAITVVPTNISYGQTETITVNVPNDATGNVTITVGSYTETKEISEGSSQVVFNIPKTAGGDLLNANDYYVFANYSGDSNYNSAVTNAPFHVDPANTTLTIEVNNIPYGNDEIINITVNGVEGAAIPSGFVTITINGTDIDLTKRVGSDGKVSFNVTGLVVGEYNVTAKYESDTANYNNNESNALFNVTKADVKDANRNISAINISYGDVETIIVFLNETNITGKVTIRINGTEIETKDLEDGKAVFLIPNSLVDYLEVNGYNVVANYSGDDNYNGFTFEDNLNVDFNVDKANVTVIVNPIDIVYKETEKINVTVTGVVIDEDATGIAKYNLTGKVTIYIDDVENQTKDIAAVDENGVLHFYVEGLAVGMHNVTAKYWDDRNYNDNNVTKDFEVINALPEDMKVIPQNITYHIQNETITVDLGEVLNGTVQLYINETLVATFEVVDQSSISYTNATLAVGNYTAKAIFTANEDSVEASANFTVSKAPTTISVEAENSTYGDTQTITVSVDNTVGDKFNLTGNVSIIINGVSYGNKTVDSNGQAVFEIDGLEANDNYAVIATYYNDVNYQDNTGQDTFKVSKADVKDANKNITAINITYGEDETITVTLNENNITGKVTITINGTEIETKELEDGKVVFTVKDLEVNGYNVVANYSGDTNYNPFTVEDNLNANFTVGKANSTIEVTAVPNIIYGNNETITVTVPIRNHTGTITLTINGTDYQFIKHLTAEDGDTITLTDVSGLAVGNYNITVTYTDDRNYNNSENYALFEVIKATPSNVTIVPQNITYTEDEILTVTVGDENATGNITVRIEGTDIVKEAELDAGVAKFNISDLPVGHYIVVANYSGDANYTGLEVSAPFHVDKAASNVTIEVANITYNDIEYANVTIPNSNASGRVIIKVDGKAYDILPLTNNTPINLELGGLAVGTHTIDVEYFDDVNYNKSIAHAEFNVTKADIPDLNITTVPTNITYLDDETIAVTVNVTNATGNVTIRINGTEVVLTKNISSEGSNTVTFTVPGLVVGDYNVTVQYTGDANYNDKNASALFHVDPKASNITVEAVNITYLDNETITVTVPITNATGTVVVKVNGTVVDERTVSGDNPSYNITVEGLAAGEYNVTAEYSNDPNYNDTNASTVFHVDKASVPDANITVVPTNITYLNDETIAVTVNVTNASGIVTITINGTEVELSKNITSEGSNTVTFTVPGLVVGEYNVTARYHDDVNYNDTSASALFHVDKAASNVTVAPTNITYLDNETITITVPIANATGTVIVKINGTEVNRTELEGVDNPTIVVNVPDLAVGEYNVTVEYVDDVNYNDSDASALFHVDKANIPDINPETGIVVLPTNITYNDDETITVSVDVPNATGKVTIRINGTDVELAKNITEDGSQTVTFTVPGLVVGDYNVTVEYAGDANYNDVNASALFTVSPDASAVSVVPINITYGENETITVTVPINNATGKVTITINGTEVELSKNITEEGSNTVTFTVPGLAVGDYNVTAKYTDDANYNDSEASALFNVKQSAPVNLTVEATNVTYGENVTVTITVPDDATGNVTITIGDYTETKEINPESNTIEFTVPDLEVNNYIVYANYSGDKNYESGIVNSPFHVDKANSTVIVEAINITYGDDETITVTVPNKNATGWVTVSVNGTEIGSKKIDADGKAVFTVKDLEAGDYEVTVVYDGDRNYNGNNNLTNFTVAKANITDANITVVPTNITYLDDETITVTVNVSNATGKVTIKINGTDVELTKNITEDGSQTVTFTVPGLVVGDYNVTVEYTDDANYNDVNASALFTVSPTVSNITVEAINITYLDNETITVTVPITNATGTVVVKVNGTVVDERTVSGDNPSYNITVEGLVAGEYNVTVEYSNDPNYNDSNASTVFHVDKANIPDINPETGIVVLPTNITYNDNETITVTVDVPNATGKVTIRINGTDVELIKNITEEGSQTVTFTVTGLSAGEYNVTVEYTDDANYNDANASALFTVSPDASNMTVVPTNITYNDDETITVTVPVNNATGKVSITINGTDVNITESVDENGVARFTVPGLSAGEYNVSARYHDDPNYNDSESSALFHVDKDDIADINVNASNITYGDNETITITIGDNNATGNITIKVNGTEYGPQELVNGSTTFNVPGLTAGDYEVEVTYSGDDNYNATTANANFTVDKATPNVYAVGTNITYGSDEQITAIVDGKNITGNVTIFIDGNEIDTVELTPTATGGRAVLNVPGLSAGNHTVKVVYNGDDNHYANDGEDNFTVEQSEPTMDLNVTNIDYHEVENITISLPEDATGTVNVTVVGDNGVNKTFTDVPVGENGTVTVPVEGLPAGNYNVTVDYSGDGNYTAANGTAKFSVSKINSTVDVNTTNITYGDNETIKYSVPEDATGTVNVTVVGDNGVTKIFNDVPVENGTVGINVADLPAGNYNVTVQYSGDDNYNPSVGKSDFTVSKAESTMDINVTDIDYHDTENITVNITGVEGGLTPTGTVNVTVVGDNGLTKTFTDVPIGEDGSVTVPVEELPAGNYTVSVDYSGDDNYNATSGTGSFKVSVIDAPLDVNTTNITYGDNETITVSLPEDATGTVNVTVVGDNGLTKTFTDLPIGEDGRVTVPIEELPAGEYEVNVTYSGDDNYNPASSKVNFTVDKATPNVYAVGTNITYGSDEQITAIVDGKNITGNVTIFIDGNEIDTVELTPTATGGRAVLNVPGLAAGNHTVKIVYNGDDNHYASEGEDNFTVSKAKSALEINTTDINYHDTENITVNVTGVEGGVTPTGTVNVTVVGDNGVTKTFTDVPIGEDGSVTVPVEELPVGNYNVTVDYSGDGNYTAANGTAKFSVSKINSTLDVNTSDITYGETENITVTVPEDATGTVNVTVTDKDGNNKTFTDVPIGEDGTVSIPVEGLDAGDYEVTVDYSGDDNYNPASAKSNFTVNKADPTVDVNTTNINYHDTENIGINVTGPETGKTPTGTVNVTVVGDNGVTKTFTDVPIGEDGSVTVPVEELPAGNYNVTVDYSGDDNYSPSTAKDTFSVGLIDTPMDLDTDNITYGDNETITVTVPEDATGNVTITIKDKDGNVIKTENVPINGGTAEITVPDLNAGNYTVHVEYPGDANYRANSTDGKFEVAKANATVEIHVYDIVYGDVEELIVTCNAPGTVTIYVNGAEITLPLENGYARILFSNVLGDYSGKAQCDLENLPVGTYPARVHYNGNENYNEADDSAVFHVIKANTTTKITVDDIKYGQDAVIDVEVTHESGSEKINANITVTVDGEEYTVELIDGKGSLTVPGLKAGEHTVKAVYPGSHNYTNSSDTAKFNVTKYDPSVKVTPKNIKVGDDETITVTVEDDATGTVTISVGGKKYTAPVENGKAVFNVPGLKAGNYTVKAKYSGDDKYLPANATAKFTVNKNKPSISADSNNIEVGQKEKITVNLPEDATGKVTVEVNGKKYTAPVKNGKAVFSIPGLKAGKYNVKVHYSGDGKYSPRNTSAKFTVSKVKPDINTVAPPVKEGKDAKIIVKVPKDATGTVTIVVDGKKYTAPVKDGKAVFNVPGLKEGKYHIKVYYSGDDKYASAVSDAELEVTHNNDSGHKQKANGHNGIDLESKKTGNPILVLLLVFVFLGFIPLRRKKDDEEDEEDL